MTLKYGQGHFKLYEQVKVNEMYYHAQIYIYHIYGVREDLNVKVFR